MSKTKNTILRKIEEDSEEAPIFLRKTFTLITSAPENIACWSDDGKSFIVKDPNSFSQNLIPQFFRHNKFASFVRQLNFYGFRKKKNNTIFNEQKNKKIWCFFHEYFIRDRPDLLYKIKRIKSNNENNEVSVLKTEVKELKKRLSSMNNDIDELNELINKLLIEKEEHNRIILKQKETINTLQQQNNNVNNNYSNMEIDSNQQTKKRKLLSTNIINELYNEKNNNDIYINNNNNNNDNDNDMNYEDFNDFDVFLESDFLTNLDNEIENDLYFDKPNLLRLPSNDSLGTLESFPNLVINNNNNNNNVNNNNNNKIKKNKVDFSSLDSLAPEFKSLMAIDDINSEKIMNLPMEIREKLLTTLLSTFNNPLKNVPNTPSLRTFGRNNNNNNNNLNIKDIKDINNLKEIDQQNISSIAINALMSTMAKNIIPESTPQLNSSISEISIDSQY